MINLAVFCLIILIAIAISWCIPLIIVDLGKAIRSCDPETTDKGTRYATYNLLAISIPIVLLILLCIFAF